MTERCTQSRIPLKPVYGPADLDGFEPAEKLGDPGAFPYTRGTRAHLEERGGWIQRELSDGTLRKVGVNAHVIPDEEDELLRDVAQEKIEPCRERIAWVREHRKQRDGARVTASLEALHACARDRGANLMPAIVAATEGGATMGEMAGVLRMAYGRPADPFGTVDDPIRVE